MLACRKCRRFTQRLVDGCEIERPERQSSIPPSEAAVIRIVAWKVSICAFLVMRLHGGVPGTLSRWSQSSKPGAAHRARPARCWPCGATVS